MPLTWRRILLVGAVIAGFALRPAGVIPSAHAYYEGICSMRHNSCELENSRLPREEPVSWRVITYRLPAEPSRHRVAVWRELRRLGAVSLQQGTGRCRTVNRSMKGSRR